MNKIKFLKNDKIQLNGITYLPYTICDLPQNFGCIEWKEDKAGVSEWFNYKGFTYVAQ